MKYVPWILFAVAAVAAIAVSMLFLNAAKTVDDARSQAVHLRDRADMALALVSREWVGRSVEDVESLSRDMRQQGFISKQGIDGSFEIGELVFEIEDDRVTRLRYFD